MIDPVDKPALLVVSPDEIRTLDAQYGPIPDIATFSAGSVLPHKWRQTVHEYRRAQKQYGPGARAKAVEVAFRAAALDTGAIEGLYRVTRGITMTIATRAPGWEKALRDSGEDVAELFSTQLSGYEAARDFAKSDMPLSPTWIRQLHADILAGVDTYQVWTAAGWQQQQLPKGEYKRHPNHVRQADGTVHPYAPVGEMTSSEMARLVDEIRSPEFEARDPAIQAAYVHYGIVAIHPFADGNGRVARALASVFLLRAFDVPFVIFHDQRDDYYNALAQADAGFYGPLITFTARRAADTLRLVVREMSPKAPAAALTYSKASAETWLAWFMDARTTSEADLRRALHSVSDDDWLFVETRLRVALHEARDPLLPPVFEAQPGEPVPDGAARSYSTEELRQWELLDVKEQLFFEEVRRRRQRGQGDLPVSYDRSDPERWLAWLVDPDTKDESAIRTAFRELPHDGLDWQIARARVWNALDQVRHDQALPVHTPVPGQPIVFTRIGERERERERELDRVLELKRRLFNKEVRRRQGQRAAEEE